MSCFRCDNTGLICNICGESESACECSQAEVARFKADHPDMEHFEECGECVEDT